MSQTIEGAGGITTKVIAHSTAPFHPNIVTLQLRYPRFIHAEFMTHRMFSRNASSSRAIPVTKLLAQVEEQPAMPIHWGKNQPGMQADEALPSNATEWKQAAWHAVEHATVLNEQNYHKQIVNRLTEPFQFISVVVTATEWDNFFKLRLHPAAQPEIHELANVMYTAIDCSTPQLLRKGQWHLPYVPEEEQEGVGMEMLRSLSAARCARVSYLNHDSTKPNPLKDIELANTLLDAGHMSPFEHQATPMYLPEEIPTEIWLRTHNGEFPGLTHIDNTGDEWSGNFKQWYQYRQML